MSRELIIFVVMLGLALAADSKQNPNPKGNNDKRVNPNKETGRDFPGFNPEGAVVSPPPIPGYQDGGVFPPYSNPQTNYPGYYPTFPFQQPHQGYPALPQVLYYSGAGQPFLVNPGNAPGNFLVPEHIPQPGQPLPQPAQPLPPPGGEPLYPDIFRNLPRYPQNPGFVPGFPRPEHIPPIEKDAEEIPKTTPQQATPSAEKKPEKLELDGSDEPVKPTQSPVAHPQQPNEPPRNLYNLQPGQRFFILNGQPLFTNYPALPFLNPRFGPERYVQPYFVRPPFPHAQKQAIPTQNLKPIYLIPQQFKDQKFNPQVDPLPLPLPLQDQDSHKNVQPVELASQTDNKEALQSRYYEKAIHLDEPQQVNPIFETDGLQYDYYKYNDDAGDEAAIIIDAKYQEPNEVDPDDIGGTERPAENSVAEAQPGAIALAGSGGVAAAGPRATALAGAGGLAVSSPHATAVAGPAKDDYLPPQSNDKTKKPADKPKQ